MKLNFRPLRSQDEFDRLAVAPSTPLPVEIEDYIPSADELERMRKAEEKRMRKRMKRLDGMAKMLWKEDESLNPE